MRIALHRLTAALWLAAYGFFAVGGHGLHVLIEHSHADHGCGETTECAAVCDQHQYDHGHSRHHGHEHHHKSISERPSTSQKFLGRQVKGKSGIGSVESPGHDHEHCVLCQLLGQPIQATQYCQFEITTSSPEELVLASVDRPSAPCAAAYRSRAPPADRALSV